jgi:single-strand DNA-binding protein
MKIYGLARLTKDAEVRYSQAAQPMAIASFGIAVERRFKREGEPEADFFDCVVFGAKAEFVSKYFRKGSRVFLEGDLRNDNYVNKDGVKVYRNRIYVEEIGFADSKAAEPAQTPIQADPEPARAAEPVPTAAPAQAAKQAAPSAPARRTGSRKAAPTPDQNGFMNIPEGMGGVMPFFN